MNGGQLICFHVLMNGGELISFPAMGGAGQISEMGEALWHLSLCFPLAAHPESKCRAPATSALARELIVITPATKWPENDTLSTADQRKARSARPHSAQCLGTHCRLQLLLPICYRKT